MFRYPLELKVGNFEVPSWGQSGNSTEYTGRLATGGNNSARDTRGISADKALDGMIQIALGNKNLEQTQNFKNMLALINEWIVLDKNHSLEEKKALLSGDALKARITDPRLNLKNIAGQLQISGSIENTELTRVQKTIAESLETLQQAHEASKSISTSEILMRENLSGSVADSIRTSFGRHSFTDTSKFSEAEQKFHLTKIIESATEAAHNAGSDSASLKIFEAKFESALKVEAHRFDQGFINSVKEDLQANKHLVSAVGELNNNVDSRLTEAIAGGISSNSNEINVANALSRLADENGLESGWQKASSKLDEKALTEVTNASKAFIGYLNGRVTDGSLNLNTKEGLAELRNLIDSSMNQFGDSEADKAKGTALKAHIELVSARAVEMQEVNKETQGLLEQFGVKNMDEIIGKGVAAVALIAIFKSVFSGGGAAKQLLANNINPFSGLAHKGIGLLLISGILQHTGILGNTVGTGETINARKVLEKLGV